MVMKLLYLEVISARIIHVSYESQVKLIKFHACSCNKNNHLKTEPLIKEEKVLLDI